MNEAIFPRRKTGRDWREIWGIADAGQAANCVHFAALDRAPDRLFRRP